MVVQIGGAVAAARHIQLRVGRHSAAGARKTATAGAAIALALLFALALLAALLQVHLPLGRIGALFVVVLAAPLALLLAAQLDLVGRHVVAALGDAAQVLRPFDWIGTKGAIVIFAYLAHFFEVLLVLAGRFFEAAVLELALGERFRRLRRIRCSGGRGEVGPCVARGGGGGGGGSGTTANGAVGARVERVCVGVSVCGNGAVVVCGLRWSGRRRACRRMCCVCVCGRVEEGGEIGTSPRWVVNTEMLIQKDFRSGCFV